MLYRVCERKRCDADGTHDDKPTTQALKKGEEWHLAQLWFNVAEFLSKVAGSA
jgi:hypothetical protein